MNSREFPHKLFESITIIYDERGNVYSIGDQLAEKLRFSKDFIRETVPEEFIISFEDKMKKFVPEKYNNPDTVIIKEPGIYILLASLRNSLARVFSSWLFSEVFPRIRGSPHHSVFY